MSTEEQNQNKDLRFAELVDLVVKTTEIKKSLVKDILLHTFAHMHNHLQAGNNVYVKDIGTITHRTRKLSNLKNPGEVNDYDYIKLNVSVPFKNQRTRLKKGEDSIEEIQPRLYKINRRVNSDDSSESED